MLYNRALMHPLRFSLLIAIVSLAACSKPDNSELDWARAALERNPQFKIVAVDTANNTIAVRVKATGEALTLTPGELAAIPLGELMALTSGKGESIPVAATLTPTQTQSPTVEPTHETSADATPVPSTEPAKPAKPEYVVQREDGHIRVTGPGVSIETHKSTSAANAPAQTFDEPIICDGRRMLHLDNKRINVSGDAIVARGGCELHITNSRIVASGTGITVFDATVHIVNSEVTGAESSLTSSSAAHVLIHNSQFFGLARRDTQATIQDQGGNTWR
jgi:hypothetical protein